MHLAIDIMGGDMPLMDRIQACEQALLQFPDLKLSLVGDIADIKQKFGHLESHLLDSAKLSSEKPSPEKPSAENLSTEKRCQFVHAQTSISMNDKPSHAIRHKMDSSMAVALQLVANRQADACLSAGNTGALVGLSTKLLGCSNQKLARPAICTALPNGHVNGKTWLLDMGANINCCGEQLYQLALLANELCQKMDNIAFPKIGLLNIGKEDIKGTDAIQLAQQLIKQNKQLNYQGYAEGDDILNGEFDIIICDGLLGNVALKSIEGTANFLLAQINNHFQQLAEPQENCRKTIQQLLQQFNPQQYNGAILLGLNGLVIKSHGMANCQAFYNAIAISRQMMLTQALP